jgi:phospholipid/cholesterol/gamma-HCH transport system substrate-binding protein
VRAAEPTVGKARPVVAGLKPVAKDLAGTFGALKPVTARLGYATAQIAPWMYDLGAFVYNTNSLFSISDADGGYGRGHATVDLRSPTGLQQPGEKTTNTYQQGGSPLGPYPAPGQGG